MPITILRTKETFCKECEKVGVKSLMFKSDKGYFFCGKCLNEIPFTPKSEKEREQESLIEPVENIVDLTEPEQMKSESELNIIQKMQNDENLPEKEVIENPV